MKGVMKFVCLLLVVFSCKGQQIVPVEKAIEYRDAGNGVPDGIYLKDVNNLLDKYVGTWIGSMDAKSYTFVVSKYKNNLSRGVSQDELLIRFLITKSDGTTIEDTRSLPDTSPYVIKGDCFNKTASYYTSDYMGKNPECGQSGTVFISLPKKSVNPQMKLFLMPDRDLMDVKKCPGQKVAEQVLPIKSIFLTKQ
ncbi:hypothetical protein DBR27_16990 [Flavobacterium sp. HMWF030]|nr:hypothetical protein DBR27_16990 [Flavobacterium sp. HMWF030]